MRHALLLSFGLLSALSASAQQDDYFGPHSFEPGTSRIVFSDTALVRAAPGGAVKDTLYEFAPVRVTRRLPDILTIGRKSAPWYEVAYKMRGENRTGCVWGGALALGVAERDGVRFLFNLLSYPQPGAMLPSETPPDATGLNTCAIKARAGGATQQCLYAISRESAGFLDASRDEDGKVHYPRFSKAGSLPTAARFLVHFYMSGEACGIPSYQISAAWNGAQLIAMPLLESIGDAGIFSYGEEYVYPGAKAGKSGFLSVQGVSEEYEDDNGQELKVAKRTVTMKRYRWDEAARQFVAVK